MAQYLLMETYQVECNASEVLIVYRPQATSNSPLVHRHRCRRIGHVSEGYGGQTHSNESHL